MAPRRHSAAAPGLSGLAGPSRRQSGRVPRTLLRRLGTAPAAGDAGNDAAAPPHVTLRADPRPPSARAVGLLLGVPAFRNLPHLRSGMVSGRIAQGPDRKSVG